MRRKAAEGSTIGWAAFAAGSELKAEMIAAQASPREIEALNQVLDNVEIWWLTSLRVDPLRAASSGAPPALPARSLRARRGGPAPPP